MYHGIHCGWEPRECANRVYESRSAVSIIEKKERSRQRGYSLDSTSVTVIGGMGMSPRVGVDMPEGGKEGVSGVATPEGSSGTMKRTRYRWN